MKRKILKVLENILDTLRSQHTQQYRGSLTDDEGLLEGSPCDVVPRWPAGSVDGPLIGPQQRGLRLRLAGGAFSWR